MEKTEIGKVKHYFDKLNVAVIALTGELKTGDTIEIETSEGPFIQVVESIQINKDSVDKAKSGDQIGMKVEHPVKEGNIVRKQLA